MKVNPNLTGVELERANKMLAAVKDIYRRGTVWSTVLSPNVTVEADQETAYPSCSSVDDMKESNKQEFFGTRDEAVAQAYSPCGRCKP